MEGTAILKKKTFSAMSIRLKYVKTNCTEDVLKCKPNYKTVVTYFFKPIIQFFIEIIAIVIYRVFYKQFLTEHEQHSDET